MRSDYHGQTTQSIDNGSMRLEFLANAGPRIVRLFVTGSEENLLAVCRRGMTECVFSDPVSPNFSNNLGSNRLSFVIQTRENSADI